MERKAEILLDLAREVNSYNGCFEDLTYTFKDLEELIEVSGKSGIELVRATFFGEIRNWLDDYFYIDSYGNFSSCSEKTFEREILNCKDEIIDEFLDIFKNSLEDYQKKWLEELGVEVEWLKEIIII